MSHKHFIINKPYGYLSQFVANHKKTKLLGLLHNFPDGTMAIGRLDEASEGLLSLTTDGGMSEYIRSKNIEKEYYVQVDGLVTDEAIVQMQQGIEIGIHAEKYQTQPCTVFRLAEQPELAPRSRKIRDDRHGPTSWISITLKEGKFRQVRKMTAAAGFPTLRLVRIRIGDIHLGDLPSGNAREIAISATEDNTVSCAYL